MSATPALVERVIRIHALVGNLLVEAAALEAAARAAEADGVPVARQLRARRVALGLSQSEVGRRLRYSRGLVADLEAGRRAGAEALRRYSAALTQAEQLRDIVDAKRMQQTTDGGLGR